MSLEVSELRKWTYFDKNNLFRWEAAVTQKWRKEKYEI
jgi:hypothetical protein